MARADARWTFAAALAPLLFSAANARAEPEGAPPSGAESTPAEPAPLSENGLSFGLRTGFAWPAGKVKDTSSVFFTGTDAGSRTVRSNDFNDAYVGMLPIWIDVGYRVKKRLYFGAYFQYALAFPGCPSGASCSGMDIRFGVDAQWRIRPDRDVDPWVGVGLGYEHITFSGKQGDTQLDQTLHGLEIFNLQLGLDYKPSPAMRIGPFASMTLGQFTGFTSHEVSPSTGVDTTSDQRIGDTAPHLWFMIGVRAAYDL